MPGSGNDIGFHIFCMNSNQSLGTFCSAMATSCHNAVTELYHPSKPQRREFHRHRRTDLSLPGSPAILPSRLHLATSRHSLPLDTGVGPNGIANAEPSTQKHTLPGSTTCSGIWLELRGYRQAEVNLIAPSIGIRLARQDGEHFGYRGRLP